MKHSKIITFLQAAMFMLVLLYIVLMIVFIKELSMPTAPDHPDSIIRSFEANSVMKPIIAGMCDKAVQDSMRSMLLVAWTFVTLAISLFSQRIDNSIFGITIGTIYYYALPGCYGIILLLLFSVEMILMFLTVPLSLPLTLTWLGVIQICKSIISLVFITYGTSKDAIISMIDLVFSKAIKIQWKHRNSGNEKSTVFTIMFSHFVEGTDFFLQVDRDFIEKRYRFILDSMSKECGGKCWKAQFDTIDIIMRKIRTTERQLFFQDLVSHIDMAANDAVLESDILLTLTILGTYVVRSSDNLEKAFSDFLSLIPASFYGIRERITARSIVYSLLNESSILEGRYKSIILSRSLPSQMPDGVLEDAIMFWIDARTLFPDAMLDITELIRIYDEFFHQ